MTPRRATDPERRMRAILQLMNLNAEEQKQIGQFRADFYLPSHYMIIEVDGGPWHNTPEAQQRDSLRDQQLANWGYRIVRFTDKQIREAPEGVITTLRGILTLPIPPRKPLFDQKPRPRRRK